MGEHFKCIDLDHWPRREHYELFRGFGFPYFSITTDIDITSLRNTLKERAPSFTVGLVYVLARAANEIPQFRQRIRGDEVIEHETVHPGVTVLCERDVFRFCNLQYHKTFERFAVDATKRMEEVRMAKSLGAEPDRDDLLFMTALPWFSFSAMVHPVPLNPSDSVPRFAWGRFEEKGGRILMPLNVQANHALMDGIHLGRYFTCVQELIETAESIL